MKKKKPVVFSRKTTCCGGQHQTIAGAMFNSKEWKAWQKYNYLDPQFDVDETQEVGDMSDEHWQAFIKWIKSFDEFDSMEELIVDLKNKKHES